jgi:hypothetical protein
VQEKLGPMPLINIVHRTGPLRNGSRCMIVWTKALKLSGKLFALQQNSGVWPMQGWGSASIQDWVAEGNLQRGELPATQAKPEMWLHPPGKTNLDLPEHNTRFHSQGSARRLQEAHQTQHTRGLANRWNPMTGLLFRYAISMHNHAA